MNIENAYHKILYMLYQSTENFIPSFLVGDEKRDTFISLFIYSFNKYLSISYTPSIILGTEDRPVNKTEHSLIQWKETGNKRSKLQTILDLESAIRERKARKRNRVLCGQWESFSF